MDFIKRKNTVTLEETSREIIEDELSQQDCDDKNEIVKIEEAPISIATSKDEIIEKVNKTNDIQELKDLTNIFGISLTKKEIARTSRESDLLDKLIEHAGERIDKKASNLTTQELLDYIKVFQSNVDKSKKTFNTELEDASLKINDSHTEININVNDSLTMSRESREKILQAIDAIIKSSQEEPEILENVEEITTND